MASKKKLLKLIKVKHFITFIIIGLAGITFLVIGIYPRYKAKALSFSQEPSQKIIINEKLLKPKRIKIEQANINISIEISKIIDGVWQVSDSSASFLETSARPGEKGNIVIYGHNKKEILGNLINRELIGYIIEIKTDDNKTHYYKITEKYTVTPSDVSVVEPTDYEVLTIYTCTGLLDSKRLIIKAIPL